MHEHSYLVLACLLILIFGLVSKKAENSPVSAPMFFLTVGLILGPVGFDIIDVDIEASEVRLIAELTLIILLFVDATFIKISDISSKVRGLPARLLFVGLPLTMIFGFVIAYFMFPQWNFWLIALLALILSPTDAALGQAVIKSPKVPERIRESISIESGLNDGIALPPILICLAVLLSGDAALSGERDWTLYVVTQLTLGPVMGLLIGYIGGSLINVSVQNGWMSHVFQRLSCIALAIVAYSFAEAVEGNGFIAAFCAGAMLTVNQQDVQERIQDYGEAEGQMLALFVFLIMGLVAVPKFAVYWTWEYLLYAVLSLTVIRIVPVFICLMGSKLDNYTKLFIAWFGPRGIASILYFIMAINYLGPTGYEEVYSIIVLTILISVFLHGASAVFMSNKFEQKQHQVIDK
ncbi:cation:proton antiporter [Thalassotalea agarivorans]|uniref:NhaP-type Na+/H+ or K+/H+ antiporter n=1 Tax=Thalassotalea agarivorans TaxID=349064 RepID=A0A1I0ES83_THASX|nr:sodium:proton antiporter [Thalassotalea agarivorans]SET48373.1 NhaP-type Na+/H+ or K+/H+ antiporter [Thalassotalea agarivorans]